MTLNKDYKDYLPGEICEEIGHKFPRMYTSRSSRGGGNAGGVIEIYNCNNCLTLKIKQDVDYCDDPKSMPEVVSTVTIVEPDYRE